jgi:hypothetical protein
VVWEADPGGFKQRFEQFLEIAARRRISVMPVLLDDCNFAGREAKTGPQPGPVGGVHNSGWVSSPPLRMVTDQAAWPAIERYVKAVIGAFASDPRVVLWDLYNEPGNSGLGDRSLPLVEAVFGWARAARPAQPLTVGAWADFAGAFSQRLMGWSDVITFHGYDRREGIEAKLRLCAQHDRPVLCTEWLLRQGGNRWETLLPLFRERRIGAYNWGLVAGRTQTYLPWGSTPGTPEPAVWQHDLLHGDGRPYDPAEIELIAKLTGRRAPLGVPPVDYQGWPAQRLTNEFVKVQVVPALGGRVIQYQLGAHEFLYVNPKLAGTVPPPTGLAEDGAWLDYGGEKLWPAPQGWAEDHQWPGPPDAVLDGGAYRLELTGQHVVALTSREDPRSGIRFEKLARLHPQSSRVSFVVTMRNVSPRARRWGIWSIVQLSAARADGPGMNALRVWCPLNPQSHFPGGYRVLYGAADNPSFKADRAKRLMQVTYTYQVGKIGLDSAAGWVATVNPASGDAFVQRFEFDPQAEYPDGSTVEIWCNGAGSIEAYGRQIECLNDPSRNPYVLESEILSPRRELKPGETQAFGFEWCAANLGGDYPVVACNDVGLTAGPLNLENRAGSWRLTGRFGVFSRGALKLEWRAAPGATAGASVIRPSVTPLAPVVLDEIVQPPAGAVKAALVAQDNLGRVIGVLAEADLR